MLRLLAAAALLATSFATAAETCDQMRDRITTQATTNGVKNPVVTVVDKNDQSAAGKVVALCGQGTKKILLEKK